MKSQWLGAYTSQELTAEEASGWSVAKTQLERVVPKRLHSLRRPRLWHPVGGLVIGCRIQGTGGTGWVRASRFFWRSELLPARLLFATTPRMIPETIQNTSLFLTHPQQRPRTPRNELLEGHFSTNPSRVWPGTRNSTYFKIGLFKNFPSTAPPRRNRHRVKHGHTPLM